MIQLGQHLRIVSNYRGLTVLYLHAKRDLSTLIQHAIDALNRLAITLTPYSIHEYLARNSGMSPNKASTTIERKYTLMVLSTGGVLIPPSFMVETSFLKS